MATTEVLYRTGAERGAAIAANQGAGLVLVHDDFNVGPDGENRLTFTDTDTRTAPPVPARRARIRQLRDQGTRTATELDELVRLIAQELV